MVDWTGCVIKDDDSRLDVKFVDLATVRTLEWHWSNTGMELK